MIRAGRAIFPARLFFSYSATSPGYVPGATSFGMLAAMPQSTNIYLARHGHRQDMADEHWHKTATRPSDPGLSDLGLIQARQLAQRLRHCAITHVFASPFLRTVQTAAAIAEIVDCDINVEQGICEWLNPDWMPQAPELLSLDQLHADYPRIDLGYRSRGHRAWPEASEQNDAWPKVDATMKAIMSEFTGNLVLIGHGSSVAGMALSLTGTPLPQTFGPCSLSQFTRNTNGWETILYGCTKHLSMT
jgi:broad specificity phosphatase PhoE